MKVLLDENLPQELRLLLVPMHEVFTAGYLGWSGLKNGKLLLKAAANGFDAVVTQDRGIEYQQNVKKLPLAVIVLQARTNKLDNIRPLVPGILAARSALKPGAIVKVK